MTHDSNATLAARARAVMPGGVSHDLRFRAPHPIYFARAKGAEKWDVEGKRYIDFKLGAASQILGHAHPEVAEAVSRQMFEMPYTGDCHPLEIEWAEWLCRLFPSAERVRFTGSGTESTMLALRLGRAQSGRDKVLRIDGHFHGWHDLLLKGSKPGANTPPSLGIPQAIADLTVVAPPDVEAIAGILAEDPRIGTVFVEVSGANYGSVPLPDGFLPAIRALTEDMGHVLVFDEVITGLRWSPGGRQARDGVVPDLTTLAKIVTGGLPGGAVVGKAEIMELLSPANQRDGLAPPVSHKGTFNAAPMVAAGAVKAMEILSTGEVQAHADEMAARLRDGFNKVFARHGIGALAYGDSSTCHLYFGGTSIEGLDAATIRRTPPVLVKGLRDALLDRGVDFMSFTSCVTGLPHTPDLIDEAVAIFDDAIAALIRDGVLQ
ncbi:aminotransferase class III-fold pyridoxal phosphate-dependent enzyme [Ruegeria sediminis]|uniref:Aminotransferase class III-fold pyridoxal phosphate-dependent enzyme n=1 Tax=Ruegeria sediminis TaxID=2583820 RepID=A0ABY2X3J2_9RHOB|nr:aminotransferase class III-fold pyridoxal phosphate-dependent enzyme [Ruegeria sediminis]TMV09947.1 aminotransferase class III-fold pyridoxal phosphate-dependent enzyme [Ruegeria sediminis]